MDVRKLVAWAKMGRARVFEVRYIAAAAHPWAVELSDDDLGWTARSDCHSALVHAIAGALYKAGVEEEPEHPILNPKRSPRLSKTGLVLPHAINVPDGILNFLVAMGPSLAPYLFRRRR